jgi:hypothetical protein
MGLSDLDIQDLMGAADYYDALAKTPATINPQQGQGLSSLPADDDATAQNMVRPPVNPKPAGAGNFMLATGIPFQSDDPNAANYISPTDPNYLLKTQQAERGDTTPQYTNQPVPQTTTTTQTAAPAAQTAAPAAPADRQSALDKLQADLNAGKKDPGDASAVETYSKKVAALGLGDASKGSVTSGYVAPVREQTMQHAAGSGKPDDTTTTKPTEKKHYFADTNGGAADTYAPLNLPKTSTVTIPAREVQLQSDRVINETHNAFAQSRDAHDALTKAQIAQDDAVVGSRQKYEDDLRKAGDALAKRHAETNKKVDAALAELQKQQVDPDHYNSQQSVMTRIMLSMASGLSSFGMALQGHSGTNPIMKMMEDEKQRDMEAQKYNNTKQMSVFHLLKQQGLDNEQAEAATQKYYLDAGARSIETAAAASQSPIRQAQAKMALAEINAKQAEADSRLYGYQRAQTAAVGGIPKEVKDLAEKLKLKSNGALTAEQALAEAARTRGYDFGGPRSGAWGQKKGAGGAGTELKFHEQVGRVQHAASLLKEAQEMVNAGGQLSPARTKRGKVILAQLKAELGYLNAGKSPNETELSGAQNMLPDDLNAYDTFGSNAAALKEVETALNHHGAWLQTMGAKLNEGGYTPSTTEEDAAKEAGATKEE